MPTILQVPGIYYGYPTRGTHGRSGVSPCSIVHHTIEGSIAAYIRLIRGQMPGYENTAHFSIGLDGTIRQHCALADAAWTNGLNWTKGSPTYWCSDPALWWLWDAYWLRISPNNYTLTLELEGYWADPRPAAQMRSTIELDRWLMDQYPTITADRVGLVGHYQIDGINKRDPGPSFPWGALLEGVQVMTAAEKAKLGEVANHVDQANQALGVTIADLRRVTGQSAVLDEMELLRREYHDWGVHWVKEIAGLN